MIQLLGDDFSIKVTEDNPLHKTLLKFSGETVVIYEMPTTKKVNSPIETKPISYNKEMVSLNNREILDELYLTYPQLKADEHKDIPVWLKLIENHILQIVGSNNGSTLVEKISENKYKKGDFYLFLMPTDFNE